MKFRKKRVILTKEKKLDELHYKVVIVLIVFWVLHYLFIDRPTIGGDNRYNIYILWIPNLLGIVALGIYRKSFLLSRISVKEKLTSKLMKLFFILLQGLVLSYLSFGSLAYSVWNEINYKKSNTNISEYTKCKIEGFHFQKGGKSSDKIRFYFNGKLESINVSYKSIKKYKDKPSDNYVLVLEIKEGLWGHYIIQNWKVKTLANSVYSSLRNIFLTKKPRNFTILVQTHKNLTDFSITKPHSNVVC